MMSDANLKIGSRIKLARLQTKPKRLTQEVLAEKIGVSPVMISLYENGKSSPDRQMEKIAKATGKQLEFFYTTEDKADLYSEIQDLVSILKDNSPNQYSKKITKKVPVYKAKDIKNGKLPKKPVIKIDLLIDNDKDIDIKGVIID